MVADVPLPNRLFDAMLGTAALRVVANSIYFHRRRGAEAIEVKDSAEQSLREPAE